MPDVPVKTPNGGTCVVATDCLSTRCVSGICCDTACAGRCMACTIALTGSSPDGTCAPVTSDKNDPRGVCVAAAPESCGMTGRCNGAGDCAMFGTTTVCMAASCAGGSFKAASTCNGSGACSPGATTNCNGFTCATATGCATTCTNDASCVGGYCTSAMTCAVKKTNGATCAATNECTSGNCVGGICCETACAGLCTACSMTDTTQANGLCRPIAAGGSSKGRCTVAGTTCGLDGTCDGTGACRFASNTKSCGAASCSSGQLTGASLCNGVGACVAPPAMACAARLQCASATACRTTCAADTDCVAGSYCTASMCTPKIANGGACTGNNQCALGACVGGTCCENACTGLCMSCTMADTGQASGLCRNITAGGSSKGRCTAAGTTCGLDGTCNGAGAYRSQPAERPVVLGRVREAP